MLQDDCEWKHQLSQQQQPNMAAETAAEVERQERGAAEGRETPSRDTVVVRTAQRADRYDKQF